MLASVDQAQRGWRLSDQLAFAKPPPDLVPRRERTACIISRQAYGATGAVRVALTVTGTPDCRRRRPRYIYYKRNDEMNGDLSRVAEEVMGSTSDTN